jgi:hypothetical protein
MKVYLMYSGRDFDLEQPLPGNADDLTADLGLDTLAAAMAAGDEFLFAVARTALLCGLTSPEEIIYRQQVLTDCLDNPNVVRSLYDIAVQAIAEERRIWRGLFSLYPEAVLHRSVEVLGIFTGKLKALRAVAGEQAAQFCSPGFSRFFGMLSRELSDDYFKEIADHLRALKFRDGVLVSARLGGGNRGAGYVLRKPWGKERGLARLMPTAGNRPGYTLTISDRDEAGARALGELRGRGVNLVANALAQATDHILSFFVMLRTELAFYIGCLNLREQLAAKGEPISLPVPAGTDPLALSARGLYDVGLSLSIGGRLVGNDLAADGKNLIMITGANQGGKSTFLRSIGLAMLMMQAGMFVTAEEFRASVASGLFTHYKREEDATMRSGKLDEELARMSVIADAIHPGALLLCNESFASTNDREGAEIARQVTRAMLDAGIRVAYVTHLYDLSLGFHQEHLPGALFLRAPREPGGRRTFRLTKGEPLPTSYGLDVYRDVFAPSAQPGATPDKEQNSVRGPGVHAYDPGIPDR